MARILSWQRNIHAVVFFQLLDSMTLARARSRGSSANGLRFRVVLFRTFITVIIIVLSSISVDDSFESNVRQPFWSAQKNYPFTIIVLNRHCKMFFDALFRVIVEGKSTCPVIATPFIVNENFETVKPPMDTDVKTDREQLYQSRKRQYNRKITVFRQTLFSIHYSKTINYNRIHLLCTT